MSLPMTSPAIGLGKFVLTMDVNPFWNTSSLKDAYRLYTFRKDIDGNKRQSQRLSTFGIGYRYVTEDGTLIQPGLSFGNYLFNENQKIGLGSSLLVSHKVFRLTKGYASISAFQSLSKGQNFFLRSIDLGLLFPIMETARGKSISGVKMGIGLSLMHTKGSFIPGINLKMNYWRF